MTISSETLGETVVWKVEGKRGKLEKEEVEGRRGEKIRKNIYDRERNSRRLAR